MMQLLVRAFKNRQSFTIGTSITTGRSNTVVWNGIHHKTSTSGGASRSVATLLQQTLTVVQSLNCTPLLDASFHSFGYPDKTYFTRVKEELASFGILPPKASSK